MKVKRFEWRGADVTASAVRLWGFESMPSVNVKPIEDEFMESKDKDRTLLELTARFDATDVPRKRLRVEESEKNGALSKIEGGLRESLEVAAANIRQVAEEQVSDALQTIVLPQGQTVTYREVPVGAVGVYAPGGNAAYPSSVLMCAIPARAAGVRHIALATPPGPNGKVNPVVLAAAELCEVDEVYAIGGAQAIFALAYGTQTIAGVDVVAGPGNAWVRAAKASVGEVVGIDSLAGPSELMVVLDASANLKWVALDLCAQAEHGGETPLVVASADAVLLDQVEEETERAAASHSGIGDAPLALVQVPDGASAIEFANAYTPEHLELLTADGAALAEGVTTAGCVFVGNYGATAFGDYAAGSNHVLPTSGAGKFSGPLGPGTFRRKIATVEVPPEAAAKLAPHVDTIARAEGFPVHGESAMIRTKDG